ncbi:MAG TPA: VOC family protein [Actinomycetota bacterium]|nr:VOC family protein [Actinomycetota bacterium]
MYIDHVIFGTADLDHAADGLLTRFGLASVPGGTHPGWGTGNRIVPLGRSYVEILGVVDPEVASRSSLGTYLQRQVADGDKLIGWCLATPDLDGTAARLALNVTDGSRELPNGEILRWRLAGLTEAMSSGYLPFFITWDVPAQLHPARMDAAHRVEPLEIAAVAVSGDISKLSAWLGGSRLPDWVNADDGPRGLQSVTITIRSSSGGPQAITLS